MVNLLGSRAAQVASVVVGPKQIGGATPDTARPAPNTINRFLVSVPAGTGRLMDPAVPVYARRPSQDESRTFELTAAASCALVVECLIRARAQVSISVAGRELSGRVISGTDVGLFLELDSHSPGGFCTARSDLYDVPFLLRGHLQVSNADSGMTDPAGVVERHGVLTEVSIHTLDGRRGTRISLGKGQGTLRWARMVDGVPKVVHSALMDLTPSGASIELVPSDPVLPEEPFVGELQFGTVRIPLLANLRRHVEGRDGSLAGLRLETGRGKRKLVDLYMRGRFPQLIPRAEVSREKLTKMLSESGYLKLRDGEGPSTSWHQYQSEHSLDFVYRAKDGGPLGHVSATRTYKRSWLLHQLATVSGHAETGLCRRALYDLVSCAPTAFDGEQACALAYFNRKLRWHQLFFGEFVEWLNDPALGTIAIFDRFERAPDAGPVNLSACQSKHGIEPLGEEDLLPAIALIRSQLAPLVADALDINPQDLQSPSLSGDPERTRTVFVLRSDDELLGVALCETGPTNASLFNILNLAQFYFCAGPKRPTVEAQLALLAAARGFYAKRGTSSPLIVAPPGSFRADQEPGTRLAESMGCAVISGAGLRQWEHYCRLQMGRLYQRKNGR